MERPGQWLPATLPSPKEATFIHTQRRLKTPQKHNRTGHH